jgi:transposase
LSVDEKPTIQALKRASGYVLTSSGKIVHGLKHLQTARHGQPFRRARSATGVIRGKITQTKKRVDFRTFMTDLVAEQPPDREIHVILDNLSTHKKNDDWLAAHPNITFHFTPTSANWLNQVEIWFGIFSRKALAGASFASIAQLVQAIGDFTEAYNQNAAPFVWRKREVKGAQLRNTIVNLQLDTSEVGGRYTSRKSAAARSHSRPSKYRRTSGGVLLSWR